METALFLLWPVILLLCFLGSLHWIYRDAGGRGKSGLLVTILAALLAWPISLLVWIALRPPLAPQPSSGKRPFNLQDYRQQ